MTDPMPFDRPTPARPPVWPAGVVAYVPCACCGQLWRHGCIPVTNVDGGRMHFDCWDEHHSDPTGQGDHTCAGAAETPTWPH